MRQEIIEQVLRLPPKERRAFLHRVAGRDTPAAGSSDTPRTGRFPASPGQRGQWFLWRLDPRGTAYNVPVLYRVRGDVCVDVLERALWELTVRHEILRTTFAEADEGLSQIVGEPRAVEIARHTAPADPAVLSEHIRDFTHTPFDLHGGPLFRAAVWSAESEHTLALCLHHAVFDEWSLGILERELSDLYNALLAGRDPAPPAPRPQIADLPSAPGEGVEYWTRALAGGEATVLPRDLVPGRDSAPAGYHSVRLSPDLLARVDALARAHGTTRFVVLLAAFHVFLTRQTRRTDLSVGTPVAGRTRPEARDLIGFLVNTLVLRTRVDVDESFTALVDATGLTLREALRHQDVPFDTVVRALGSTRGSTRGPLFRVMFTQSAPATDGGCALDLHGTSARPLPPQEARALFDLTVMVAEEAGGAVLTYEYAADRYLEDTVRGWADDQVALLRTVTDAPDAPVAALLPADGREGTVRARGATRPAPPDTVPGGIARLARQTPDTVAVRDSGGALTYADVARRAAALAARLRTHGARPERLVALALPTGTDAVVAVLACWWAGAAFVPFALDDPVERSRALADGLDVCAVVAPPGHRPLGDHPAPVVEYSSAAGIGQVGADTGPVPDPRPTHPAQLAYVIHTSGSTGRPKGVMIQHDQMAEHAANGLAPLLGESTGTGRPLNVALGAAVVFDVFVNQLLSLALGHTLVVLDTTLRTDPRRLADALRDGLDIDVLDQPPALLPLLLDTGVLDTPRAPHTLLFGGEPCPPEVWERLREHSRVRALNCYGPTECTVDATVADAAHTSVVTVGTPHPNTTVHVLDEHLRPLPVGAVGEVYLGGPRVGRGYAHAPALTAARFLPDPFTPGGRLYRTGDQGRLRSDGNLEFRGRRDRQVQIRGRRVELGEVEEALAGLPGVRAAAVVLRRTPGDARIRAYAMADADPAALRSALARRLPAHMVPTDLVVVDRFPLTVSGKIDTGRLPEPRPSTPEDAAADPRDDRERLVAEAWREALGLERVGVFDDFFDLGGHSLLAVRLAALLEVRVNRPVEVDLVLTEPTVAAQAKALDRIGDDARVVVPMGGTGDPVTVLVHPVGGSLLCYRRLAARLARTGTVFGLRADVRGGAAPRPGQETGLRPLAAHYADRLVREIPGRRLTLMGWSLGGTLAQAVATELARRGAAPERLVLLDTLPPEETDDDREEADRLAALAAGADPGLHGATLRSLGVDPDGFASLPPSTRADLARFWSALLGASVRHRPEPLTTPTALALPHLHDDETAAWAARGWASLSVGGLTVHRVPGDHFSLLDGLADTGPAWLTGQGARPEEEPAPADRTAHIQASTEIGE